MAQALFTETERLRHVHRVLVMLYQERRSQAEIAGALGLSPATVNRLVKEGHDRGLVDIRIRAPFGPEQGVAAALERLGGLDAAEVVAATSTDPAIVLRAVAEAAARALLDRLEDGMTVAVSGGVALCAVVEALRPTRTFAVRVVPATGGVQGRFRTDVNHVAVAMAERLGGTALQLHAPVFGATEAERAVLMGVSAVASVFDAARGADVAVVGVGSVQEDDSTYHTLTDAGAREPLGDAEAELLAHLVDGRGRACAHPSNRRLVALTLPELARIPARIAVASGERKVGPLSAVLKGGLLGTLVTDGRTGRAVVERMGAVGHAA